MRELLLFPEKLSTKNREMYILYKDEFWQSREAQNISGAASSFCVLVKALSAGAHAASRPVGVFAEKLRIKGPST